MFLPRAVLCQPLIYGTSSLVIDSEHRAEKMKHGHSDEAQSSGRDRWEPDSFLLGTQSETVIGVSKGEVREGEEGQGQAEPRGHAKKFWFVSTYSIKSSLWLLFGQWPGRRQEWKHTRRKEGGWDERYLGSRRGHEDALDFFGGEGGVERGRIQDTAPVFWLKQLIEGSVGL